MSTVQCQNPLRPPGPRPDVVGFDIDIVLQLLQFGTICLMPHIRGLTSNPSLRVCTAADWDPPPPPSSAVSSRAASWRCRLRLTRHRPWSCRRLTGRPCRTCCRCRRDWRCRRAATRPTSSQPSASRCWWRWCCVPPLPASCAARESTCEYSRTRGVPGRAPVGQGDPGRAPVGQGDPGRAPVSAPPGWRQSRCLVKDV